METCMLLRFSVGSFNLNSWYRSSVQPGPYIWNLHLSPNRAVRVFHAFRQLDVDPIHMKHRWTWLISMAMDCSWKAPIYQLYIYIYMCPLFWVKLYFFPSSTDDLLGCSLARPGHCAQRSRCLHHFKDPSFAMLCFWGFTFFTWNQVVTREALWMFLDLTCGFIWKCWVNIPNDL